MRMVMTLVVGSLMAASAHAQSPGDPLRPLTKCTLELSIVSGRDVGQIGTDRLRAIVDGRLRSLGIRVITDEDVAKDTASIPAFEVRATTIALTSRSGERIGTSFYLDMSLIEWTTISRTHALVPAVLWTEGHLQATGVEDLPDVLARDIDAQLDKFATALHKANPTQKP